MPYFEDDDDQREAAPEAPKPITEVGDDIAAKLAALDAERARILSAGKTEIATLLGRLAQLCRYHGHLKKADFPEGIFATRKRRAVAEASAKKKPGRKPKTEKQS